MPKTTDLAPSRIRGEDWPIKKYFFLFKRPDMTHGDFTYYWSFPHSALAQDVDPTMHRVIVQDVFERPEPDPRFGSGLVETYHKDELAIEALWALPVFSTLLADEPNFVIPNSTKVVTATETTIVDREASPTFGKLLVALRGDLVDGEAARAAIVEQAKALPEVVRVTESRRTDGPDVFDVMLALYFPDDRRREAALRSDAWMALCRSASEQFGADALQTIPVLEVRRR